MNKIFLAIVFALLLQAPVAQGSNWTGKSPFVEAMRSMLDLFTMLQSYQQLSSISSMSGMGPITAYQGQNMFADPRGMINPFASPWGSNIPLLPPAGTGSLNGAWVSNAQQLLIVKDGLARIYWSRDDYQDYYLKSAPGMLLLKEADSGIVREFEMAGQQDQLALRNRQGQVTLFRKYYPGIQ